MTDDPIHILSLGAGVTPDNVEKSAAVALKDNFQEHFKEAEALRLRAAQTDGARVAPQPCSLANAIAEMVASRRETMAYVSAYHKPAGNPVIVRGRYMKWLAGEVQRLMDEQQGNADVIPIPDNYIVN